MWKAVMTFVSEYKDLIGIIVGVIPVLTVFFAWWRERLPPLKLGRVHVYQAGGDSHVLITFENKRPYEITIQRMSVYSGYSYSVDREPGQRPTYRKALSSRDQLGSVMKSLVVHEMGAADATISVSRDRQSLKRIVVLMSTSHGSYTLTTSRINQLDNRAYALDYVVRHSSAVRARLTLIRGYLHHWLSKTPIGRSRLAHVIEPKKQLD